jgi:hypothetical protein
MIAPLFVAASAAAAIKLTVILPPPACAKIIPWFCSSRRFDRG